MYVHVLKEYFIDTAEVLSEHPELWKEYQRWNGEDEEGFVMQLLNGDLGPVNYQLRDEDCEFYEVVQI